MKLFKEAKLLNQVITISSKIEKEEIFSFLEENDIFEDTKLKFKKNENEQK
jgi:hypothetical protein